MAPFDFKFISRHAQNFSYQRFELRLEQFMQNVIDQHNQSLSYDEKNCLYTK